MFSKILFWIILILSLAAGFMLGWIDTRPKWDDTGIMVLAIFFISVFFGLVEPKRFWLWAIAIGGWIPLMNFYLYQSYDSIVAIVIATAGSYSGVIIRKTGKFIFGKH